MLILAASALAVTLVTAAPQPLLLPMVEMMDLQAEGQVLADFRPAVHFGARPWSFTATAGPHAARMLAWAAAPEMARMRRRRAHRTLEDAMVDGSALIKGQKIARARFLWLGAAGAVGEE